jgi:hypothetical protein
MCGGVCLIGWNKTTVLKLLLLSNIVCIIYTIASTAIYWIEPSDLGIASRLPLVFYVGLFLLGSLWYVGLKFNSYLSASLALTIIYLFAIPTVVRVPVWISNSYYPFGESLIINSAGHLSASSTTMFVSYRYWPLFLYFSSALTIITDVPHDILLKFFPLLSVSMYGIFTFLILRIKLAFSYAMLGSAFVLASLFIRQQYYGPQSISYIFFLAILLLGSRLFFGNETNQRVLIGLLIPLFLITTFMHPLTSLMSVIVLFALFLTRRFVMKERSANLGLFLLLSSIIWLAYNNYAAEPFINTAIKHFSEIIVGFRGLGLYSEPGRIIGSIAMQLNFVTSWAIVGLGGIIGILSVFHIIRNLRARRLVSNYSVFNIILLFLLGLFALFGEYGDAEGYQRAFMFGLVPLSFLCTRFLSRKPKIFVVLITVLFFLNIPAQYGADTFRLATDSQLSGTKFVADVIPDKVNLVGGFSLYIRYHNPFKNYTILDVGLSHPFTESPNSTAIDEAIIEADYIMISQIEHNYNMFYLGFDPFDELTLEGVNRIYDNGDFILLKT